jgi:hypothetical protein
MEVLCMSETDGRGLTRREALALTAVCLGGAGLGTAAEPGFQLSVFQAEITTPLGHPLMGGGIAPARSIEDPLYAHGFTLHGAGQPEEDDRRFPGGCGRGCLGPKAH